MNEIKKLLGSDKLIMGKDRTMKHLKKGELEKIFLANNLDKKSLEDLEYYANINNTEIEQLKISNEELGTFCKKPFAIAVMSLLK